MTRKLRPTHRVERQHSSGGLGRKGSDSRLASAVKRPKKKLREVSGTPRTARRRGDTDSGGLDGSNAEINGLLVSNYLAVLLVDRNYRVKSFSPAAVAMLDLTESDKGRRVDDLKLMELDRSLLQDVRAGLETGIQKENEIHCGRDCWCLRRTLPHAAADGKIEAVAVTMTDVTMLRRKAERELAVSASLAHSLEDRDHERTEQLRKLMFELARLEDRERRTIASELHDGLGQLLAVANVRLAEILDRPRDPVLDEKLNYVRELVDQANRAARSLIFQISPPVLSELGLVPAVEWLGEEMYRIHGLSVAVHYDGSPISAVSPAARFRLFRCVRELLMNVVKHAKVHAADVQIHRASDQLHISVSDEGVGFDKQALDRSAANDTFGMVSIRERIAFMGGRLDIDSHPGDGTVVTISVPLAGDTVALGRGVE